MLVAVTDTHSVIWYLYEDRRLSPRAYQLFEGAAADGDNVGVSSISLAEIVYLVEKSRIPPDALARLLDALSQPSAVLFEVAFERTIAQAMTQITRRSVPDMPDRMIAATATHLNVPLITRDARIRAAGIATIW